MDPDGGWDGWYDRSGVSFFVDGVKVDAWEFNTYLNNPGHGAGLNWSGTLFAGSIDFLSTVGKDLTYNSYRNSWGLWSSFKSSSGGNIPNNPGERPVGDEEIILPKNQRDVANITIGLKWLSGEVSKSVSDLFLSAGLNKMPYLPPSKQGSNGEIKPRVQNEFAALNENYGFGGRLLYSQFNGLQVFWRGFLPGDIQNLDGSYLIRGSSEHQFAAVDGMFVIGGQLFKAVTISKSLGVVDDAADDIGKSISIIAEKQLKKHGIDAHELKKEFLGNSASISRYDLYKDKLTNEILIFLKGGKGDGIQTGEFLK